MSQADTTAADIVLTRDESAAVGWQGAWMGAILIAAVALTAAGLPGRGAVPAALVAGAVPALWAMVVSLASRSFISQASVIVVWAFGVEISCALTGGVAGPLAAWCLAPLVASLFMPRPRLLVLGGAASLAAATVSALGAASLNLSPPPAALASGLGLLSLTTIGAGLAAGLALLAQRVRREPAGAGGQDRLLADQGLLLVDLSGTGAIEATYGRAPQGLAPLRTGSSLIDCAAPADRQPLTASLEEVLAVGEGEAGFAPADAPDRWVMAHLRRRPDGALTGILRDATEERMRQRDLERARDLAEAQSAGKSRFLANMSHELRTPLNAIMGFSDIMRQRLFGPLSDRYGEYAELVHESGSHLLELINDILDMSKIEAERYELSPERFDAREAVNAVLRLMRGQADRAGVQLRGVLPPQPMMVDADRRALKQIALNLLSNALKFTLKDGAVTVTAREADGAFELVVADTGTGISEEDMARLGNPYEQAGGMEQRSAGTGLGLALVRAFARLHGGDMEMASRLGEGTTVTVRLPVMAAVEKTAGE